MIIRREAPSDRAAIRRVNEAAFGGSGEANAIDALRNRGQLALSLVAVEDEQVVGHILFTPAIIESADRVWPALGLAPLAVLPECQRQGIGTALMQAGLEECRQLGYERIIVLGHTGYYPRFGFVPARRFSIGNQFGVKGDEFMILEMRPGALDGVKGIAKYQPEWSSV
jgi:putative acetyltransferase